jgi:hypothetical protein
LKNTTQGLTKHHSATIKCQNAAASVIRGIDALSGAHFQRIVLKRGAKKVRFKRMMDVYRSFCDLFWSSGAPRREFSFETLMDALPRPLFWWIIIPLYESNDHFCDGNERIVESITCTSFG